MKWKILKYVAIFIVSLGKAEGNFNPINRSATSNIGANTSFDLDEKLLLTLVSISNLFFKSSYNLSSCIYERTISSLRREDFKG